MMRQKIFLTLILATILLSGLPGSPVLRARTPGDGSDQGDIRWNVPERVSDDSSLPTAPRISTADGVVHLLWYGNDTTGGLDPAGSGLRYSRRPPGTTGFTSPVTLLPATEAFLPGYLASSGGMVFVAAAAFIDPFFGVTLLVSDDSGSSWADPIPVLANAYPELLFTLDSIVFIQYIEVSTGSRGILRSTDGGNTWGVISHRTREFSDVLQVGRDMIAVGPATGGSQTEVGFFVSVDSGRFWYGPEIVSPDDPVRSANPRLAADGRGNYSTAWVDTGTVLIRSSRNSGISWGQWTPLSNEPGSVTVDLAASGDFVFAVWDRDISDSNGIRGRFSVDGGVNFGPVVVPGGGVGAKEPVVNLLDSVAGVAWVEQAGDAPGIYFRDGVLPPGTGNTNLPPETYTLSQSYPNPTNGIAVIAFGVPVSASLSMELYNVLGERIGVIAAGPYDPGRYTVTVDVSGLPSGVYLYRLTAPGFDSMKKILVLR